MKQRRRIYYSAAQRSEIWDRWQAGESMSSIGRRFDRESSSVFSVISPTGGIRPPLVDEPSKRSAWVSGRRFREGSVRNVRCVRSLAGWVDRHPRSAVKFIAMVAWIGIGLHGPIRPPGIGRCALSSASWLAVRS